MRGCGVVCDRGARQGVWCGYDGGVWGLRSFSWGGGTGSFMDLWSVACFPRGCSGCVGDTSLAGVLCFQIPWGACLLAWMCGGLVFSPWGLAVTLVCLLLCACCVPCFVHWFRTAARAVIPCLCPCRAGAFQSYPLFLTTTLFPCFSHALPSLSGSFSLFWIAPVQAGHL